MSEYFLFIDTETSDKPRQWKAPTEQVDKWPYLLQVAWTIYSKAGEHMLNRNFYINPGEITIHEESLQIHGITIDFLQKNGMQRKEVLKRLSEDLMNYSPVIIGHFIKFDIKMLEVGFNRTHIKQDLSSFKKFCTMVHTHNFIQARQNGVLKLDQLYKYLFCADLKNQHDALIDAEATRACFFELLKRGDITDKEIEKQQRLYASKKKSRFKLKWF